MKKVLALILFFTLSSALFTCKAEGLSTPPTDNVTIKHYSMGAYVQPDGEELNWDDGYYITMVYSNTSDDVWVSNLFPQYFMDGTSGKDGYEGMYAWIHATVKDNRITFNKENVFHYADADKGTEYDFTLVAVADVNGVEVVKESFDFVIDDNGNIQIDDDTYNPSIYVCLIHLNDNGSVPTGDNGVEVEDYALGYELTCLTDAQTTYPTVPANVDMLPYKYNMTTYMGETGQKTIQLGFSGNDVYAKGMTTIADYNGDLVYPDVVFKGTMEENGQSFSLPSGQFYGIENYFGVYYITFLYGLVYNEETGYYDPLDEVKFEKHEDGSWEMAEDTNLSCMTNGGTLYELIALSTLTPAYDEGIDSTPGNSLTPTISEGKGAYNTQGQRVGENYKGIVIKNGKKILK